MDTDNALSIFRPAIDASLPMADFTTRQGEHIMSCGVVDGRTLTEYIQSAERLHHRVSARLLAGISREEVASASPLPDALYLGGVMSRHGLVNQPPQWWLDAQTACIERLAAALEIPADYLTDERRSAINDALEQLREAIYDHE